MAKSIYTIIDIETTGGDPRKDRITEIAAYRYDGSQIIDTFESLINPEIPIPPYITRITGIDNEMVRSAPKFYEIAKKLVEITQDAVFVAHNVRFDYSFIQKEFRNLGYTFTRRKLCTVQLSRRLVEDLSSHGLGKLCEHFGIENQRRHRAAGDAWATLELFKILTNSDEESNIKRALIQEIAVSNIPPTLTRAQVEHIPEETGVYYFHNSRGQVIYVGKSRNIRKRILSHFQGAHKTTRKREMFSLIHDVSYELTGSELIALLKENEEIKRLQPPYNQAQKRNSFRYGLFVHENQQGYHQLIIDKIKNGRSPVAKFSSKRYAVGSLARKAKSYELCPKYCGLEHIRGCFYHQLAQCRGACIGEESPGEYNDRVQEAITALNFGSSKDECYLVIGEGRTYEERSVVYVKNGIYQGWAYLDLELLNKAHHEVCAAIPQKVESPDVRRIIQGYIKKKPKEVKSIPAIPE